MRQNKLLFVGLACLICGCTAKQKLQTTHSVETVRVEHTVDTVFVTLPQENLQAVVSADSVSRLHTSTAESTARLTPEGYIEHRLYTRDTVITVPVPTIVTTRTEQNEARSHQSTGRDSALWPVTALLIAIVAFLLLLRKQRGPFNC